MKLSSVTFVSAVAVMSPLLFHDMSDAAVQREETTVAVARASECVVLARCISMTPEWNATKTLIHTLIRCEVIDSDGRVSRSHITLKVPGGRIGDFMMNSAGFPDFHPGDEVILFLNKDSSGERYILANVLQGALFTHIDPLTGRRIVEGKITGFEDTRSRGSREERSDGPVYADELMRRLTLRAGEKQ